MLLSKKVRSAPPEELESTTRTSGALAVGCGARQGLPVTVPETAEGPQASTPVSP